MKIGILSMQRIVNYGSFFQAYSLKTILESMGHQVCFVDFKIEPTIFMLQSGGHAQLSGMGAIKERIKAMLRRAMPHVADYRYRKRDERYRLFAKCYPMLGMTPVRRYRRRVDVLLIGSDEVFNCLQRNEAVGYSLELFGKDNRANRLISYAASFGDTTLQRLREFGVDQEIGRYLSAFDALSVRDQNSADIVGQLCGIEPCQHLDPVLIGDLEKREWKKCELKNFLIVYAYSHRINQEEEQAIMSFATERQLKVIILNGWQRFGDTYIVCGPDEILGYFAAAEYVVTDTFHGAIFSVLYHKPLAVFCRMARDTEYSNENKLLDLLDKLELTDRLVSAPDQLERVLCGEIDYEKVDRIRARERESALNYLKMECGG